MKVLQQPKQLQQEFKPIIARIVNSWTNVNNRMPIGSAVRSGSIQFSVRCETKLGEHVVVCGSTAELGNWSPQKAMRLQTNILTYPLWTSPHKCFFDQGTTLQFKFVILTEGSLIPRWQTLKENRHVRVWSHKTVECRFDDPAVEEQLEESTQIVPVRKKTKGILEQLPGSDSSQGQQVWKRLSQTIEEQDDDLSIYYFFSDCIRTAIQYRQITSQTFTGLHSATTLNSQCIESTYASYQCYLDQNNEVALKPKPDQQKGLAIVQINGNLLTKASKVTELIQSNLKSAQIVLALTSSIQIKDALDQLRPILIKVPSVKALINLCSDFPNSTVQIVDQFACIIEFPNHTRSGIVVESEYTNSFAAMTTLGLSPAYDAPLPSCSRILIVAECFSLKQIPVKHRTLLQDLSKSSNVQVYIYCHSLDSTWESFKTSRQENILILNRSGDIMGNGRKKTNVYRLLGIESTTFSKTIQDIVNPIKDYLQLAEYDTFHAQLVLKEGNLRSAAIQYLNRAIREHNNQSPAKICLQKEPCLLMKVPKYRLIPFPLSSQVIGKSMLTSYKQQIGLAEHMLLNLDYTGLHQEGCTAYDLLDNCTVPFKKNKINMIRLEPQKTARGLYSQVHKTSDELLKILEGLSQSSSRRRQLGRNSFDSVEY